MFSACVRWSCIRWKVLGHRDMSHMEQVQCFTGGWRVRKNACLCVQEKKVIKGQRRPFVT